MGDEGRQEGGQEGRQRERWKIVVKVERGRESEWVRVMVCV